ncbi:MAG: sce7726 family protein [Candidatus Binatus sp.]|uniref:sce7726 family protein n=1 Tax=Candidatus Binatus sp. TaxID=2811406 RepID=UPI00271F97D5|nr:sce7726 family protein [Candidatus Binatus sp.]MDO8434349.1 sce7726 family protein [Candidatus Binatus sp.]
MWDAAGKSLAPSDLRGHILASLFRPGFVRSLAENRHLGIIQEMGLMPFAQAGTSIAELFEWAYDRLNQTYRCEYVYKNEILHKRVLSQEHPSLTAIASEFLIGNNRLDLLVINGTTVAYEIKTGYDDLERLPVQMAAYLSVFDRVSVVCDPAFVDRVKSVVDERIGIVALTPNGSMPNIRPSISNVENVDPVATFDLLRATEYVPEAQRLFGVMLDVPNTQRRRAYLEYFKTLSSEVAHDVLLRSLRARFADRQSHLVNSLPNSMVQMYYEANARTRSAFFGINSLNRPLLDKTGSKDELFSGPSR